MSQYTYKKEQNLDTVKVSDGTLIFDTMLLNNYHIHIMHVVLQVISNGTTVKHIQKSWSYCTMVIFGSFFVIMYVNYFNILLISTVFLGIYNEILLLLLQRTT